MASSGGIGTVRNSPRPALLQGLEGDRARRDVDPLGGQRQRLADPAARPAQRVAEGAHVARRLVGGEQEADVLLAGEVFAPALLVVQRHHGTTTSIRLPKRRKSAALKVSSRVSPCASMVATMLASCTCLPPNGEAAAERHELVPNLRPVLQHGEALDEPSVSAVASARVSAGAQDCGRVTAARYSRRTWRLMATGPAA